MGQYFENEKLPSKVQKKEVIVCDEKFVFYTDNGVFSKDGLDFGSRLLIETIVSEDLGNHILDVGCGYGPLGIVLGKIKDIYVDMIDVNLRALHLAERNARENHFDMVHIFESDCYDEVKGKYTTIVTNPPIRAGKKIVYEIVMNAKDYLEQDGKLFLVIRKEQGAKSLISDMEKIYNVEVLERKKGFFIIKCTF